MVHFLAYLCFQQIIFKWGSFSSELCILQVLLFLPVCIFKRLEKRKIFFNSSIPISQTIMKQNKPKLIWNTFHILDLMLQSLIPVNVKQSSEHKKSNRTHKANCYLLGDCVHVLLCCRLDAFLLQSLHFFSHLSVSPQRFL